LDDELEEGVGGVNQTEGLNSTLSNSTADIPPIVPEFETVL
jgi:hypothetical protein